MEQGSYEQASLFADQPSYSQKKRQRSKPLRKQRPEVTQNQEGTSTASLFPLELIPMEEPPYPLPQRACYVCEKTAWVWDGEKYVCTGDAQVHQEYEVFLQRLHKQIFGQR